MSGVWDKLPRPFFALAPMEDVTDTVFRQVMGTLRQAQGCGPDVMFTEFANVEAIIHGETQRLEFTESERPLIAQVWGNKPESFFKAAKIVADMGFDGIDINMGCPVRKIVKSGCSALIGENNLVAEIITAVKDGGKLPVSVKTRIGKKKIITEEWIGFLLEQKVAAITIHGRTVAEQSKVQAHWDEIGKAVKLRKNGTLIVGNGDVDSMENAQLKIDKYGVDGVMIGRGVLKNPWFFNKAQGSRLKIQVRFDLLKYHVKLWEETWGKKKNFAVMKKFIKMYVNGFEGAAEVRAELIAVRNSADIVQYCRDAKYPGNDRLDTGGGGDRKSAGGIDGVCGADTAK